MEMLKKICVLLLIFAGMGCFSACDEDQNCRKERFVAVSADIKKVLTDPQGKRSVSPFQVERLTLSGLNNDSILYNNAAVSSLSIYLKNFSEETQYRIVLNDTIDTLTIRHRNTDSYLSFQCGCIMTHLIDTAFITGHFIDSVAVVNKQVNTQNAKNIELYKHYKSAVGN